MPTYQELRGTYALMTIPELRNLARRPLELTDQAQAALADELSLRDVLTEYEIPPSLMRTPTRAVARRTWLLTMFQAWVTFQILGFGTAFAGLHPFLEGWRLLVLAIMAVQCFGLVLIANRNPLARRFWLRLLAMLLIARLMSAPVFGLLNVGTLIGIAMNVAWYLYWLQSRDVAAAVSSINPLRIR